MENRTETNERDERVPDLQNITNKVAEPKDLSFPNIAEEHQLELAYKDIETAYRTEELINNFAIEEEANDAQNETLGDSLELFYRTIRRYPIFTVDEERYYTQRYYHEKEDRIKEKIINHNLGLSVFWARKQTGRGLDLEDLVQAGNQGLIKAVENFDPTRNDGINGAPRFSSFASVCIKQNIERTIANESQTIRLPQNVYVDVIKLMNVYTNLQIEYGRKATTAELAESMGLSQKKVLRAQEAFHSTHLLRLNDPITSRTLDNGELGDIIPNSIDVAPERQYLEETLSSDLYQILLSCGLQEREIDILALKNGLNGEKGMTLAAIGKIYSITKQAVNQIELKALKKIRRSPATLKLLHLLLTAIEESRNGTIDR